MKCNLVEASSLHTAENISQNMIQQQEAPLAEEKKALHVMSLWSLTNNGTSAQPIFVMRGQINLCKGHNIGVRSLSNHVKA